MNAPKHTAGPWEAIRDESHFDTLSTVVAGAVTGFPGRQMMVQVGGSCGITEQEANARLIAAAPDLLEATEPNTIGMAARSIEKDHPGIATTLLRLADRQRAAIAKATEAGQ